jgi:hypothetical protein
MKSLYSFLDYVDDCVCAWQINGSGVYPSCWRQQGMDEYISVGHDLDNPSTFSIQEDVEFGHTTNNEVRTMTIEEFVQVAQQGFDDAEKILEQNRMLIQEISQNKGHRDTDGLARNSDLIRRLNTNIAYAFDLYSNLIGSFNDFVSAKNTDNSGNTSASDSPDP